MAEQPDDTDWVHNLEHRERLTIGFWGSIEKYNEWTARKEEMARIA